MSWRERMAWGFYSFLFGLILLAFDGALTRNHKGVWLFDRRMFAGE